MEDRLKRTVGILMILWKNKIKMDKNYWENRYQEQETGWDIGYVSTPIKSYFDQISDKNISILVPGAGHAYEAEYLHFLGFKNVTVIDIAQIPLDNFSKRFPDFPNKKLICSDFFDHSGSYDLILEQTFFCALNPERGRWLVYFFISRLPNKGLRLEDQKKSTKIILSPTSE